MVKNHSDSQRGNLLTPLHGLLFPISSNGSFICTIPQTRCTSGPDLGLDKLDMPRGTTTRQPPHMSCHLLLLLFFIYHILCYTSRGAQGPTRVIDPTTLSTTSRRSTTELHLAPKERGREDEKEKERERERKKREGEDYIQIDLQECETRK